MRGLRERVLGCDEKIVFILNDAKWQVKTSTRAIRVTYRVARPGNVHEQSGTDLIRAFTSTGKRAEVMAMLMRVDGDGYRCGQARCHKAVCSRNCCSGRGEFGNGVGGGVRKPDVSDTVNRHRTGTVSLRRSPAIRMQVSSISPMRTCRGACGCG